MDGLAASFDGYQLCWASRTYPLKSCKTLAEIRKERRASIRNRKRDGLGNDDIKQYGHRRVQV